MKPQARSEENPLSGEGKVQQDAQIVKGIHRGETEAEEALVAKYWQSVLHTGMRNGLLREDAEEVAIEVFTTTIEKAKGGSLGLKVWPWLERLTINRAMDWHRQNKREKEHGEEIVQALGTGSRLDQAENEERQREQAYPYEQFAVRRAIKDLSPEDQEIVTFVAHNVTIEELAKYLDVSRNNARQRKLRALERLRKKTEQILARSFLGKKGKKSKTRESYTHGERKAKSGGYKTKNHEHTASREDSD